MAITTSNSIRVNARSQSPYLIEDLDFKKGLEKRKEVREI